MLLKNSVVYKEGIRESSLLKVPRPYVYLLHLFEMSFLQSFWSEGIPRAGKSELDAARSGPGCDESGRGVASATTSRRGVGAPVGACVRESKYTAGGAKIPSAGRRGRRHRAPTAPTRGVGQRAQTGLLTRPGSAGLPRGYRGWERGSPMTPPATPRREGLDRQRAAGCAVPDSRTR